MESNTAHSSASQTVTETKVAGSVPPPPTRSRQAAAHQPPVRHTTLSSDLEPEKSKLGMYLTVGVIGLLIILVLYQVFSKSSLSAQVRELKKQNAALQEQVAALEAGQPGQTTQPEQPTTPIATNQPTAMAYYPVVYRNGVRQQVGQLIRVATDTQIAAVYLQGNGGSGDNAELAIFETDDPTSLSESPRPITSKLFDASQIPTNQQFAVQLDRPYTLRAGRHYLIVVRPSSTNAQANIGYSASNTTNGEMWVHARRVTAQGEVLDTNPEWQSIPNVGMALDLRVEN